MNKKNQTALLVVSCGLLLLVVVVLVQSLIRRHQVDRIAASIKQSVVQASSKKAKQQAFITALSQHKADIEFMLTHEPILNISFQKSDASGDICGDLLDQLRDAEALAYDAAAEGAEGITADYLRSVAIRLMEIYNCAI